VCLNDPAHAQAYLAVFQVGPASRLTAGIALPSPPFSSPTPSPP
jgi:hypothetical protein